MQPQIDKEFNDPVLKDAVRRCWACDCCPAELQKKIARLCECRRSSGRMRSWVIWTASVAAGVLLAVGVFHQVQTSHQSLAVASVLPTSLQNDLIIRHDFCCKKPDHQRLKVPKDDDSAIASELRARLNRPVLVFHPKDADWQFRGAAVCPVGTTPAGHLVFVKGNDALSIFSLPQSLVPAAAEGTEYAINTDDHCIVGFVKDGALFCLVSSGPVGDVSIEQLKQMESQMRPAVARMNAVQNSPVMFVELLRPIGP